MLLEHYNVAMFFPRDAVRMGSLLLSKGAIARQMRLFPLPDAQQSRVPVCNVCHRALKVKRKKPQPPMISISNGLFHGELPDNLKLASRIDIKIVTPAYLGGSTFSILATMLLRERRQSWHLFFVGIGYVQHWDTTGTAQHVLRGHVYCTKLNVHTVASTLPLHPEAVRLFRFVCFSSALQ